MKTEIRCSMLPSYADCPRRSACKQYKYIIKAEGYDLRQLESSIGASVGTACHKGAIAACDAKKIDTTISIKDMVEMSIVELHEKLSDGVIWDSTTGNKAESEKQIEMLLKSFSVEVLPHINSITKTEYKREAIAPGIVLSGSTDVETIETIDDLKFGSKISPYFQQLGGYKMLRDAEKLETKKLRLFHLPRTSVKKQYPGAKCIEYDIDECVKEAKQTIVQIKSHFEKFIETKEIKSFPANPMSNMCSDKYCPAWGTNTCKLGVK